MQKTTCLLLTVVSCTLGIMIMVCTAVAQARRDPLEAHVDQVFAPWDKPDSPGAAVVIVKDGAILYKRGYGMANLEYDIPAPFKFQLTVLRKPLVVVGW